MERQGKYNYLVLQYTYLHFSMTSLSEQHVSFLFMHSCTHTVFTLQLMLLNGTLPLDMTYKDTKASWTTLDTLSLTTLIF